MSSSSSDKTSPDSKPINTLPSNTLSPAVETGSVVTIYDSPLYEPRVRSRRSFIKMVAFICTMTNCLFAGSFLLYSLYVPYFQKELAYSQIQINAVSTAGELGMYLPVPIFGLISDRSGPHALSILAAFFFGPSYLLASYAIKNNLPFWVMIVAWALVGAGTSCMYFSGVTTSAKNFTGNGRGIALALPIAAFGLSSLWESQLVSRVFVGRNGELNIVEVFRFFAVVLTIVGLLGGIGLRVVPTEEEKLESKAVLDVESDFGETSPLLGNLASNENAYGSNANAEEENPSTSTTSVQESSSWLGESTMSFLTDKTMWWFSAGIFLVTGTGEAFINNMGTIIQSLYHPDTSSISPDPIFKNPISTATHLSIVAITSTLARLFAGLLSDYLAPSVPVNSPIDFGELTTPSRPKKEFTLSRMYILLSFAILMLFGQLFLASGMVDNRGELFWIVSSSIGAGYGAIFTLAPTVVSIVWGVESFGTNWGIVSITPAIGATLYGMIFAKGYDDAVGKQHFIGSKSDYYLPLYSSISWPKGGFSFVNTLAGINWVSDIIGAADANICYGKNCYDRAFFIMSASVALACVFWVYAWRGSGNSWIKRGVVV